jgi:hypothetical protein
MTKAAIYARVSTEEQLTGYSIAAQVEACRKLCADHGWTVAAEFVEGGESGKTFAQRPQWQAFMQGARNGEYQVLVCHKIDRFSRATILDSLQTLKDLKELGINFTSASEPIDLTTPYGEVMLLLMLWFARQYLTNLSGEVTTRRRDTRLIRGMHDPLVPQALFDRTQAIRKTRDRREGQPVTNNRVYLLKDLAHCAHCGGRMKCSYSRLGQIRYTCYAHTRAHDPKPCKAAGRAVREDRLMPQIDALIASLRLPDAVINRAAELATSDTEQDKAQARRHEIIAEMKRLDYLSQKGRKKQKEYEREVERLEAELHLLEPQIADVFESGDVLSELADAWVEAGDDQAARREILLALLQSVRVDALEGVIVKWNPHPEFAPIFDAADVGGYKFGSDRIRTLLHPDIFVHSILNPSKAHLYRLVRIETMPRSTRCLQGRDTMLARICPPHWHLRTLAQGRLCLCDRRWVSKF